MASSDDIGNQPRSAGYLRKRAIVEVRDSGDAHF
jgi:hypothetical protein